MAALPTPSVTTKECDEAAEELDLMMGKTYRMVTKAYLANGKDGYDVLAKCKQV